ncbi:hypothetical protein DFH07DRAFT_971365 [Mycena maculata]|uniref:Uncharacterized protein n=1 Tax=Mycena maculata TaxID=230809 RepID=A0AAD7HM67_9AGAR|nr:hypothetical protein DFH07DRAFT_971365 [Mycena maculata]
MAMVFEQSKESAPADEKRDPTETKEEVVVASVASSAVAKSLAAASDKFKGLFDDNEEDSKPDLSLLAGAISMQVDTTFMEDLEQYRTRYNPDAPCEVFELDLQDPLLYEVYEKLPPLKKLFVLPSFVPEHEQQYYDGDMKGGRVRFSIWPKSIKNITAVTIWSAVTFTRSGVFINPSQISPALIWIRPTRTSGTSQRINIGSKVAICVSAGMCSESKLTRIVRTFGPQPREHKYMALTLHNQDYERWESWMCLCFGHDVLYTPMTNLAIQLGTILTKPEEVAKTEQVMSQYVHPDMLSPIRGGSSSPAKPSTEYKIKYALLPTDTIPIFDATKKNVDFNTDLPKLAEMLPRWKDEIPVGAFVVTGYTVTTYKPTTGQHRGLEHIGCNILWAVVCGIPKVFA